MSELCGTNNLVGVDLLMYKQAPRLRVVKTVKKY